MNKIEETLPPGPDEGMLTPVFRRLDAIAEMVRSANTQKAVASSGTSCRLAERYALRGSRLAVCFEEDGAGNLSRPSRPSFRNAGCRGALQCDGTGPLHRQRDRRGHSAAAYRGDRQLITRQFVFLKEHLRNCLDDETRPPWFGHDHTEQSVFSEQWLTTAFSTNWKKIPVMTRFAAWILLAALMSIGGGLIADAQETGEKAPSASLAERLQPKIHKLQKELPDWSKTGNKDAAVLEENVALEQIQAKQFEDAEKTADSLLKMMGVTAPMAGANADKKSDKPASGSQEETVRRLNAKRWNE